jgi:hypothetical protein
VPTPLSPLPNVCSNTVVLEPEQFGLSADHYRISGMRMTETAPPRCPRGHPLGRDTVLIGNHPCVKCTGSSHRTWRCRECDACWIWPRCRDRPDLPEWTGVRSDP